MKVLIVGENSPSFDPVRIAVRLRWPDATFTTIADCGVAVERVEAEPFDIVVVMIQRANGEVPAMCREIRELCDVPIMAISQVDQERTFEDVRTLEAGADDFVRNTVGLAELVARFAALMRRAKGSEASVGSVDRCGTLTLKPATFEAYLGRQKIDLTTTEFNLLHLLMRGKGNVVRHQVIERALWGDEVDSTTLVKKYVHRLRRKLMDASDAGHEYIRSIYGIGYLLVADEVAPIAELKASA